ncbi:MAG: hypothetical protein QOJ35_717 [Solirubrobacteraceae bacterium]|jgi:FtsP/CotA-like multicopper oxidase with cupredoxin domain|nr:hypothetical protein [Solirubrobacteraceae bacterium]
MAVALGAPALRAAVPPSHDDSAAAAGHDTGRAPAHPLRQRWHGSVHDALPRDPHGARRADAYEFDALPFGLHLYHCHVRPLDEHISKGLYGAFVIDPKDDRPADELVMVMNGFDTNFDRANDVGFFGLMRCWASTSA